MSSGRKTMKKVKFCKILFLVGFLFLSYGCGSVLVQPPTMPNIPIVRIQEPAPSTAMFQPPVTKNSKFVEKSGKNIKTEDNVSVRVTSIVDKIENDKFSVTIEGPDGTNYKYSIFPMMLVLEIKNNTDHILTLRRTIINLEDEKQVPYPLINTLEENKRRLADEIGKAFDRYTAESQADIDTSQARSTLLAQFREVVFGPYKTDYDRMLEEVREGHSGLNEGIRTPDMQPGYHKSPEGERELLQKYHPQTIYSRGSTQIEQEIAKVASRLTLRNNERRTQINRQKEKAVQQVMSLPAIDAVITGGEYLPISILPDRSKEIIVPFSKRNRAEEIKSILVGIYDLPTKVNEAGDPTKRTNFNFHMVAETSN
jgi:hypothetical protein